MIEKVVTISRAVIHNQKATKAIMDRLLVDLDGVLGDYNDDMEVTLRIEETGHYKNAKQ